MRVVGGEFRSRVLKTLATDALRPTSDRLRQALFDVLAPRIAGTVFVDAYAGSGAVGIEALSRGAARAIFLEKHRAAVQMIRQNLKSLGIESRAGVFEGPAAALLARHRGDIVFLDPPYPKEAEYRESLRVLGADPPPLVVVQHSKHFDPGETHARLNRTRTLSHGDNVLTFYSE